MYAELQNAALSECRRRDHYHLGTNIARGTMVYQDFMGTQDLAHDLDTLRTAIGADKLSIWGISYGTAVGATYATVYPERVDKMILDGNVAVSNEIYKAANLFALSYEQVWNGLAAACNNDFFVAGGIDAPTLPADDYCAATPYPTDKMYKLLGAQTDDTLLIKTFTLLGKFFEPIMWNGVSPGGAVMMACVESLHKDGDFNREGCCEFHPQGKDSCCTGKIQTPANSGSTFGPVPDENPTITLVFAVDMAGRLSTKDIERLWADLKDNYPIGFLRAANIVPIVSAPNLPRPVPPYGSGLDKLQPLIIGDFHDPATTYTASQDMRDKFPNGALMSWHGYHHGLFDDGDFGLSDYTSYTFQSEGYGAKDCYDRMLKYLEDGTPPPNGYTCPINGPAAGSLSLKVAKQVPTCSGWCCDEKTTPSHCCDTFTATANPMIGTASSCIGTFEFWFYDNNNKPVYRHVSSGAYIHFVGMDPLWVWRYPNGYWLCSTGNYNPAETVGWAIGGSSCTCPHDCTWGGGYQVWVLDYNGGGYWTFNYNYLIQSGAQCSAPNLPANAPSP